MLPVVQLGEPGVGELVVDHAAKLITGPQYAEVNPNQRKRSGTVRQSQDSRVLCEEDLLDDPAKIGYAVLDVEDEWQLFSTGDQSNIVAITLEEALVLLPELALLDFL